jgi:hypothetical protein
MLFQEHSFQHLNHRSVTGPFSAPRHMMVKHIERKIDHSDLYHLSSFTFLCYARGASAISIRREMDPD